MLESSLALYVTERIAAHNWVLMMFCQAFLDEERLSDVKLDLAIVAWNVLRFIQVLSSGAHRLTSSSGSLLLLLRRILILGSGLVRILVVLLLLLILLIRILVVLLLLVLLIWILVVLLLLLLSTVGILRVVVVLLIRVSSTRTNGHGYAKSW